MFMLTAPRWPMALNPLGPSSTDERIEGPVQRRRARRLLERPPAWYPSLMTGGVRGDKPRHFSRARIGHIALVALLRSHPKLAEG
jgi:hypothetical protein